MDTKSKRVSNVWYANRRQHHLSLLHCATKKILGYKTCVGRWLQEHDICPHHRSADIEESVMFMGAVEELIELL